MASCSFALTVATQDLLNAIYLILPVPLLMTLALAKIGMFTVMGMGCKISSEGEMGVAVNPTIFWYGMAHPAVVCA